MLFNTAKILTLLYMFNVGYMPFDDYGAYSKNGSVSFYPKNTTQVEFQLGLSVLDFVDIYGGEITRQQFESLSSGFYPYYQQYYCGLDLHYTFNEKFTIHSGVYRTCNHGVSCWNCPIEYKQDNAQLNIYLKVEGKVPLL